MFDSRPPGPLPQVVDEVLEVGLFTFSHHFNPPIGKVLRVTREAKLKGFLTGEIAVAHPLYLSTDQHGDSQHESNLQQRHVQTGLRALLRIEGEPANNEFYHPQRKKRFL